MGNLFNYQGKQRLHTQLVGETTGKELFKVNEYEEKKKVTGSLIFAEVSIFTILYFFWKNIPIKITVFIILCALGLGYWLFINLKNQKELKEQLYN